MQGCPNYTKPAQIIQKLPKLPTKLVQIMQNCPNYHKAAQINSEYGPHNHKATQISLKIAEITTELQKLAFETTQKQPILPKR